MGIKVLNLHGFLGEADNKNYRSLCEITDKENITAPKLDYLSRSPEELVEWLSGMVSEDMIFVGQSLGGLFADFLSRKFDRPCILTNPCYFPYDLPIITETEIPKNFFEQYRSMAPTVKNPKAYILCSDGDELIVGNYENCQKFSEKVILVHGEHSYIENRREELLKLWSCL